MPQTGLRADCVSARDVETPMSTDQRVLITTCYAEHKQSIASKPAGYDRLVIPFSPLCCSYRHENVTNRISINRGGALFISAALDDQMVTEISVGDHVTCDTSATIRASLCEENADSTFNPDWNTPIVIHPNKFLANLAGQLRGTLGKEAVTNETLAEAYGVLAVSVVVSDAGTRRDNVAGITGNLLSVIDQYIAENLDRNVSLDELAEISGLSLHHFARSFKKVTGKTPYQYVLTQRIYHAQRLLAETRNSIAEIAYECGFSSQSHLTAMFGRLLGTTPGQFRSTEC